MPLFVDRKEAGRRLATRLDRYRNHPDLLVLGLPRGGVPVAHEVALALRAELDVLVVRKIGVPFQPELAMGAIASGGAVSVNDDVIAICNVGAAAFERVRVAAAEELRRRENLFRGRRPPVRIGGRTVLVVDDGLATGASMRAALLALRTLAPAKLVVAVPVAPPDAAGRLAGACDEFVCVDSPDNFGSVGRFYANFEQTTDEEVRDLLRQPHPAAA